MLLPLALCLSACADANMAENANSCRRVLSAQEAQMVFAHSILADGSVSMGPTVPSSGKLCAEQENKRDRQQIYDLHKVGHVQPILPVVLSENVDGRTLFPNDERRLKRGVTR